MKNKNIINFILKLSFAFGIVGADVAITEKYAFDAILEWFLKGMGFGFALSIAFVFGMLLSSNKRWFDEDRYVEVEASEGGIALFMILGAIAGAVGGFSYAGIGGAILCFFLGGFVGGIAVNLFVSFCVELYNVAEGTAITVIVLGILYGIIVALWGVGI